jgi:hypothetical protein
MNPRWLNPIILGLAVPCLAAGAWGTANLATRASAVKPNATPSRPLAPEGEPVSLNQIAELKRQQSGANPNGNLEAMAGNAWGERWSELRKKIQALSAKTADGQSIAPTAWIDGVREGRQDALVAKLREDLGLAARPADDELKSLAAEVSALLGDSGKNLATVFARRIKALDEFKAKLPQPDPTQAAPDAKSDKDRTFSAAGIDFVWVPDGGFWISKDEIMNHSASLPDIGSAAERLKADGIPKLWIALADLKQWQAAKKAAAGLGLVNFDKGQGEFLADGTIVGAAEEFKKSAAVADKALSPVNRIKETAERSKYPKPPCRCRDGSPRSPRNTACGGRPISPPGSSSSPSSEARPTDPRRQTS